MTDLRRPPANVEGHAINFEQICSFDVQRHDTNQRDEDDNPVYGYRVFFELANGKVALWETQDKATAKALRDNLATQVS
jgi:hypothetical protein